MLGEVAMTVAHLNAACVLGGSQWWRMGAGGGRRELHAGLPSRPTDNADAGARSAFLTTLSAASKRCLFLRSTSTPRRSA
jgi:hypothetical protein